MTGEPAKRRSAGLGRGLSALLGDIEAETPPIGTGRDDGLRMIAVADIRAHPGQPRRQFDEEALDELAASVASRGVLQPIIVRVAANGYEIIAGERRWRAAQRAQLHEIPALVRDVDDATAFEVAIVENIQRQDLNAIEEAEAYQKLIDGYGHSQEALARFVHKSRSHVANLLRLLDLPTGVRTLVADGTITMGHARALVTAEDAATLADEVVRRGLSVRETERLARSAKGRTEPRRAATPVAPVPDADVASLERQLGDMLGVGVAIAHDGEGGGSVTLRYSSLDQLDMLCQRLSGEDI